MEIHLKAVKISVTLPTIKPRTTIKLEETKMMGLMHSKGREEIASFRLVRQQATETTSDLLFCSAILVENSRVKRTIGAYQ